jgi:hypothetical protein
MSRKNSRTLLIILLISIFICACPGLALIIPGIDALVGVLQTSGAGTQEEFTWNLVQSGGAICLSIVLILIPVVLLLIWVLTRKPKDPYDQKEPTGASSDDPLPPTR